MPGKEKFDQRMRVNPLNEKKIARRFAKELDEATKCIQTAAEPEEAWAKWKEAAKKTAERILPKEGRQKKNKKWITDEILELINRRRQVKDRCSGEYRALYKEVIRKCREAKSEYYEEKCQEVQKLEKENRL